MSGGEVTTTSFGRRFASNLPTPGPLRTLMKATLVNTVGNGLFYTVEVIFFTRSVGLSTHDVALGLGIAAAVAILANVPIGHLADRRGPRELGALFLVLEGCAMGAFVLVHSFTQFLAVAVAGQLCASASSTLRVVTMSRFGEGEARVRVRALQRAVSNVGMAVGTLLAGVALAFDTRSAYVAMVLGNAITFVFGAFFVMKLPPMPPRRLDDAAHPPSRFVALRDRRFLLATALNGLFSIHFMIQSVGLPLWILEFTSAPRWTVALLLIINTTLIVLFQVRASKGTGNVAVAARAYQRSGVLIALACVFYALAHATSIAVAMVALIVGMLFHSLGELYSSAASWGIAFGMASEELQGQYQGLYSMGMGLSRVIGPLIVTSTAIAMGRNGWLLLAAFFLLVGSAYPALVRSFLAANDPAST
ncbi:MAG: hypothetical protein B7X07_01065 [Actinobacteria bacterium 21-64-8]|nr:MAG: hypothetical protein B7X07_01065 [Actinobacteria bacterium 21-64-8]